MAYEKKVTLPAGVWTQVTQAAAAPTSAYFQNVGNTPVLLKASAVAPVNDDGAVTIIGPYPIGADKPFSAIFPGSGGATTVWGRSESGQDGYLQVAHA